MISVDKHEHDDEQTSRELAKRAVRARRALRFRYWKQFTEKLREKWVAFTKDIILFIAEEEMKINREEVDKQIGNRTR